jgi:ubiquinone/menaquinone biosynthesis C-methylase UbiE
MEIENVKDYWNNQPCNVKHSSREINTKEYFEEVIKKRYFVEPHIIKFMDLEKWKGKKVLEIGCGIGSDAYMFASNGADYTGIELSDKTLEISKKRFEIFGLSGNFYNMNAEDLSKFDDNTFDLIYSFGVIHHTVNPDKIINEVRRVLKPGGTFKLMLYATNSWKKIMIDVGLDQYEAQPNTPIAYTYTNEEVNNLLSEFTNINIEQTHIFPYKIPEYKNNTYVKEAWFENMPDVMYDALKTKLGWHLCISCNK